MNWKIESSKVVLETPHFSVVEDSCLDSLGDKRDYWKVLSHVSQHVMIVPVKINLEPDGITPKITYVMVEQYRHGCGAVCLEFPAGRCDRGEASADAAARELLEETGYKAKSMKFLYTSHLNPVRSADQQAVYVAIVEDQPDQTQHEPSEIGSGMTVKEFSAAELHQKVLKNEITSSCTLSALCSVLLSNKAALKYLEAT